MTDQTISNVCEAQLQEFNASIREMALHAEGESQRDRVLAMCLKMEEHLRHIRSLVTPPHCAHSGCHQNYVDTGQSRNPRPPATPTGYEGQCVAELFKCGYCGDIWEASDVKEDGHCPGCTQGQHVESYAEPTDEGYRAAAEAKQEYGVLEVDSNAVVSRGDDPGAYVQCWVWVSEGIALA